MRYSQLLLVLSVVGTWPAKADSPDPKMFRRSIPALPRSTKRRRARKLTRRRACSRSPILASASDRKQIECLDREQRAWDKIINDSYKTMMNGLRPEPVGKLRDMQRGWIRVRDQTCTFWCDYFQGTMANLMTASCRNRETARRAIYLRVFAIDIAQRK